MPKKLIIQIGVKFGRLTVLEDVSRIGKKSEVRCLCDCGNEKIVQYYDIKNGATKSCGCLRKESNLKRFSLKDDQIAEKYGMLTLIKEVPKGNLKSRRFEAKCDCGKIKVVCLNYLRNNLVISCGCYRKKIRGKARLIDVKIGDRYGKLTIIEEILRLSEHFEERKFKCLCDCGNEKIILLNSLRTNRTLSCGCYLIEKITKHGDSKLSEYKTWSGMKQRCYNPKTKWYKI